MKSLLVAVFAALSLQAVAQISNLQSLFNSYYSIKNALIKDDAEAASKSAGTFVNEVQNFTMKPLSSAEQTAFISVKEKLRYNAQHISEVKKLDHQREHFSALSDDMYKLAQATSSSLLNAVYLDYCPMKNQYWLSDDKKIQNPYYGSSMLTCGNVEKTIMPGTMNMNNNVNDTTPEHNMHHDMNNMQMSDSSMGDMNMSDMPGMTHSYSRSLPMSRDGSGTSWSPDNNPMYMIMTHTKKGAWMFHGSIFFRYDDQQLTKKTSRSDTHLDAPNWMMAMYNRPVGKNGLFNFTGMFSLDALTVTPRGYPLLFQSGESYKGEPLVDRQHPHDLFAALSIGYTQRLSKKVDVFGYFGYPGEPAISAPTFMHRTIALNDPDAPLSHHWQDATHITFGVATAGVRVGKVKGEFSWFTGREPDEHRYDFDKPKFDSYSWRVSFNPSAAWAFQVSQAYIKSPEDLHPDENVWRYTASALYSTPVTANGSYFSGAAVWGMNDESGNSKNENSALAEGTQQLMKQAIYGRYEYVQKSTEELNLEDAYGKRSFDIHKLTLGTNRQLFTLGAFELLGGLQASVNVPQPSLQTLYGKAPMSGQVYVEIRPKLMKMDKMGGMKM